MASYNRHRVDAAPSVAKRRLFLFIAVAASTTVLLMLLEVGSLLVLRYVSTPVEAEQSQDTITRTLRHLDINAAPLVRDVELLWRNKPGVDKTQAVNPRQFGRKDTWTIKNNASGYRGGPTRVEKAPGVFRILCVGDSVTFGFNVDQPDAYPRQLERILRERAPGMPVEVINAGVPGWSWLQGRRFLQLEGLALKPNFIVIGHGVNDRLMRATTTDAERFAALDERGRRSAERLAAVLERSATYRLIQELRADEQATEVMSPGCEEQLKVAVSCKRVTLDQIEQAVLDVVELAVGAGAGLLVANLDFLRTDSVQGPRAAFQRQKFHFVDPVSAVRSQVIATDEERAREASLSGDGAFGDPSTVGSADTTSHRLLLRVRVPDLDAPYTVRGVLGGLEEEEEFHEPLYDDATHGDERSGDGVYSATLRVGRQFGIVRFRFYREETAEFTPLPPLSSSFGDRVILVRSDRRSPVYGFGDSPYMAERTHPNREGQTIVANLIADTLMAAPRFQAALAASGSSSPTK